MKRLPARPDRMMSLDEAEVTLTGYTADEVTVHQVSRRLTFKWRNGSTRELESESACEVVIDAAHGNWLSRLFSPRGKRGINMRFTYD